MERLQETGQLMGRLMQDMPDQLKEFSAFIKIAEKDGAMDAKSKHLILLSPSTPKIASRPRPPRKKCWKPR